MILQCYIDDKTARILRLASLNLDRTVEELAESLIAEGALDAARHDPKLAEIR